MKTVIIIIIYKINSMILQNPASHRINLPIQTSLVMSHVQYPVTLVHFNVSNKNSTLYKLSSHVSGQLHFLPIMMFCHDFIFVL